MSVRTVRKLACLLAVNIVFFSALLFSPKVKANYYSTTVIPTSYKNLGTPRDVTTLGDGKMWYVDSENSRIVKIDSSGNILRTVGRAGSGEGEFEYTVTSITHDTDENLYVLDYRRIYKLDFNGGFIKSFGTYGNGVGEMSEPRSIHYSAHGNFLIVSNTINNRISKYDLDGNFISEFGVTGNSDGQFDNPYGLTADSSGNIYVADSNNQRVQVFQEDGTFIRAFGTSDPGDYHFDYPKDVEVLDNGDIIVTSQNTPKIKKFDSNGTFISEWGENGNGGQQFISPEYLTKAADDTIWVTDWNQKRLQHFTSSGVFEDVIGNSGTTDGKFANPYSVDFDSTGNMYVLDNTGRVQKFDEDGNYVSTPILSGNVGNDAYHVKIQPTTENILVSNGVTVSVFSPAGTLINTIGTQGLNGGASGNGDFNQARGMAFDSLGYLYVTDLFNSRVQKFDLTHVSDVDFPTTYNGGFVLAFSVMGFVEQIAIDSSNILYISSPEAVAENGNTLQVDKYNTAGIFQSRFLDKYGTNFDEYYTIGGLFVDSVGKMYLTDRYYNRVQVYNSDGSYSETIGGPGSDIDQYSNPNYAKINPISESLVVVDTNNHRLQILTSGVKIKNLIPSADVINIDNSLSLVRKPVNPLSPEVDSLAAEMYFGDYIVSDFTVDLTSDRDWMNVNAISLPNESRSLVVNLNPSDAPGISSTHSLYIVKHNGQNSVRVCTAAAQIAEVTTGCLGYDLQVGDPALTTVTIGLTEYWKVTGLTGTGAFAEVVDTPDPTPYSDNNGGSSGSNNSSSSSSSNNNSGCSSSEVAGTPDLFQINVSSSSVKMFFTPLSNTNNYYFSYSTNPFVDEYGAQAVLAREGVQNYTISLLKPSTTYYFKVRGQNGCKSGGWSNQMKIVTRPKNVVKEIVYYKNSIPKSIQTTPYTGLRKSTLVPVFSTPTPAYVEQVKTATPAQENRAPVSQPKSCKKILWWCI